VHLPFYLSALLLLSLLYTGNAFAGTDESKLLRAAYIYNFSRFSTWPDASIPGNFILCVITADRPGVELQVLESRTINNNEIEVRHYTTPESLDGCTVAYLPSTDVQLQQQLVDNVGHSPVLTVSTGAAFIDIGGMISFENIIEDSKFKQVTRLGFMINLVAAQQAGIELSSKMLNLATDVKH